MGKSEKRPSITFFNRGGIRGDVEMTHAEHDREISINRLEKFSRTV